DVLPAQRRPEPAEGLPPGVRGLGAARREHALAEDDGDGTAVGARRPARVVEGRDETPDALALVTLPGTVPEPVELALEAVDRLGEPGVLRRRRLRRRGRRTVRARRVRPPGRRAAREARRRRGTCRAGADAAPPPPDRADPAAALAGTGVLRDEAVAARPALVGRRQVALLRVHAREEVQHRDVVAGRPAERLERPAGLVVPARAGEVGGLREGAHLPRPRSTPTTPGRCAAPAGPASRLPAGA